MREYKAGDIVRYTAKFRKSIGLNAGCIDGKVLSVTERGYFKGWPVVDWHDNPGIVVSVVCPANIELYIAAEVA